MLKNRFPFSGMHFAYVLPKLLFVSFSRPGRYEKFKQII